MIACNKGSPGTMTSAIYFYDVFMTDEYSIK